MSTHSSVKNVNRNRNKAQKQNTEVTVESCPTYQQTDTEIKETKICMYKSSLMRRENSALFKYCLASVVKVSLLEIVQENPKIPEPMDA